MSTTYEIKQIQPAAGDWFCVWTPDHERWFIERVIAWALVSAEGKIDHVRGIDTNGMPHYDDEGDSY